MNKYQQKAWNILTSDEQTAITLKLAESRSSWQAGAIMGKAHYKYLEIVNRAEYFMKLFEAHFRIYDELLPYWLPIGDSTRKYLDYQIMERLSISDTVKKIDKDSFYIKSIREEQLLKELVPLINTSDLVKKQVMVTILEFDRWNNHRILPTAIQEPSAFKRRNKNIHLRHIKNFFNFHPYTIRTLIERHDYTNPQHNAKILYCPLYSTKEPIPTILTIKQNDEKLVTDLSRLGFYLFKKRDLAIEYVSNLLDYWDMDNKTCKAGQEFWTTYRKHIKNSTNYNLVGKIIPSRKFLRDVLQSLELN